MIQDLSDEELLIITRLYVEQITEFLAIKEPLLRGLEYKGVLHCVLELTRWLMTEVNSVYTIFKYCIQMIIQIFPRLSGEIAKEAKEFCFLYNTLAVKLREFCQACKEYHEGEIPSFRGLREDTLQSISIQVVEQENIRYSQNLISLSPQHSPAKKASVNTPVNNPPMNNQFAMPQAIMFHNGAIGQPLMYSPGFYPVVNPQFSPYMAPQPMMYPHMMGHMQKNSPFLRKQ